jgi:hypothetical protein
LIAESFIERSLWMDAGLLTEREPGASLEVGRVRGPTSLRWITILLVLLLLTQIFQVVTSWQRTAAHVRRVEQVRGIVDKQQTLILGLLDSYHAAAYGNTEVDRIAEQQLVATEYTLSALQVMAIENSQIIELLADAP